MAMDEAEEVDATRIPILRQQTIDDLVVRRVRASRRRCGLVEIEGRDGTGRSVAAEDTPRLRRTTADLLSDRGQNFLGYLHREHRSSLLCEISCSTTRGGG